METAVKAERYVTATVAVLLIFMAAAGRLLPHPANFAPVTAIAIFGGALLPRRLAVGVPLAAMLLSDLVIGLYEYRVMAVVWACYALTALASSRWLARPGARKTAALTVAASLFFFAVTNFAVWAGGGLYAHTWRGLADCYTRALPFFRNTFLSDALYTVVLFGLYALVLALTRYFLKPLPQER